MSYHGPYGPPHWPHPPPMHPPPHHYPPPPPHHHSYPPPPPHHHSYPPPPSDMGAPVPYPYYYPGTMMIPVPIAPVPTAEQPGQSTYITNYIYHGENAAPTATPDNAIQAVESSGEFDWIPTTATMANTLTGRAVVGGHEGWDGSPLWVIRSWHNGDLVPGKLSVRHNSACIVYNGKEIPVQNIEVLCASPENLRWVPASNGNVPAGAVPGGRTATGNGGETLYVGRARYQLSITPGKVHPSHNCCYIAFAGQEVAHKMYDVLCRVS